eukprot:scaffold650_cov407-Prasinococcus_capsulatus_cf.AAC.23
MEDAIGRAGFRSLLASTRSPCKRRRATQASAASEPTASKLCAPRRRAPRVKYRARGGAARRSVRRRAVRRCRRAQPSSIIIPKLAASRPGCQRAPAPESAAVTRRLTYSRSAVRSA